MSKEREVTLEDGKVLVREYSTQEVSIQEYVRERVESVYQTLTRLWQPKLDTVFKGVQDKGDGTYLLIFFWPGANDSWTWTVMDLVRKVTEDLEEVFGTAYVYPVHGEDYLPNPKNQIGVQIKVTE